MSQYISRQLNAIDEIKSKIETVVQSVSSGGWDLSQGRMSGGRAAADLLDDWNVRFHGTLPDEVMLILGGLMTAVRDWRSNMGQTATPADLIEGPGNTVNGLLKAVSALQAKLNAQIESHAERARNQNITISNSSGVQISSGNTQTVIDSLKLVVSAIDSINFPDEDKQEAKKQLDAFLRHPLVTSVLGGVSGGITGLFSG